MLLAFQLLDFLFVLLAVGQLKWEKNSVCLAKQSARRLWGFLVFSYCSNKPKW